MDGPTEAADGAEGGVRWREAAPYAAPPRGRDQSSADSSGPGHSRGTPLVQGRVPVATRMGRSARAAGPAIAAYAAVRLLGVAVLALWARHRHMSLFHRLTSWDTVWYVRVAAHGYAHHLVYGHHGVTASDLAFFPLYPALMRAAHTVLPLTLPQAGLLVAAVCALLAAWGIREVAATLHGSRIALIAVVLWGCWPVAIVENMAYTESLLTACAAWALYAGLTQRWITAGLLSVLAGLSRPSGCAVAAGVMVGALVALYSGRRGGGTGRLRRGEAAPWWHTVLGLVLAPLGWLGYIAWVGHRVGRADGYFVVQTAWKSTFDWGAATWKQLTEVISSSHGYATAVIVVAALLTACVGLFLITVAQRQPLMLVVYTAALLVIALGDAAYFVSRARFLLPAFPLLLPPASALAHVRNRATLSIVLTGCAALSALFGGYLLLVWPKAP